MEAVLAHNSSEALGLFAIIGAVAGMLRWRQAVRKDFLSAFVLGLVGMALRELPVYMAGMATWSPEWILVSAAARVIQIIAVILFILASLRGHCSPWWLLGLVVAVFTTAATI